MFQHLWDYFLSFQRVTVVILEIYIAALIVAEVIFRYFLHASLLWVEELVLFVVFWFYFLGASLCTYERSHIKGGAIQVLFRNRQRGLLAVQLGTTILSLGLSCFFTYWGYQTFIYTQKIGQVSVHLGLPVEYAHLSLVPGFGLIAIYFLAESVDIIKSLLASGGCENRGSTSA